MGKPFLLVFVAAAVPLLAATPDANRETVRRAAVLMEESDRDERRMLFLRRRQVEEFDSSGKTTSRESITVRREQHEGLVFTRVVARNDKPLTGDELREQDERLRRAAEEHRSRQSSKRRPAKNDGQQMLQEFVNAMDFRRLADETFEGRPAFVFAFSPRPDYRAPGMKMKVMEKMLGKLWIDKSTNQLLRGEAEVTGPVTMGLGLVGKVGQGTRFEMVRREVAPGIWMPVRQHVRFEARLMLVKSFRQDIETTWGEFQLRPGERVTDLAERRD